LCYHVGMNITGRFLSLTAFLWLLITASPAAAKRFSFAVFADNQPPEYLVKYSRVSDVIVADIAKRAPAFVVTCGDHVRGYVYSELTSRRMWRTYASLIAPLKSIPVHNVVGNHDIWDEASGKLWDEYMGKRHYSWEYENNLFIALDAETDTNAITGEQLEWLKKLLSRTERYDNVFVAIHRPFFRPYINGKLIDWDMNLYTRPKEEAVLLDLLAKSGMKMGFAGHYHEYDLDYRHGILQFITGGGGGELDTEDAAKAFHHYLWVDVDGKKVDVKVIRPDFSGVKDERFVMKLPSVIEDFEADDGPNVCDFWNEKVGGEMAPMPDGKGGRGLKITWDFSDYEWPMLMLDFEPFKECKAKARTLSFEVLVPEGTPVNPPLKCWVSLSGKNGEYSSKDLFLKKAGRQTFSLNLRKSEWTWNNKKEGKAKKEKKEQTVNLAKIGPLTSFQFALSGYGRKEKGIVWLDNITIK